MRQFVANAPKAHESLSTEAQKVPVRGTAIPLICISQHCTALAQYRKSNMIRQQLEVHDTFALEELVLLQSKSGPEARFNVAGE